MQSHDVASKYAVLLAATQRCVIISHPHLATRLWRCQVVTVVTVDPLSFLWRCQATAIPALGDTVVTVDLLRRHEMWNVRDRWSWRFTPDRQFYTKFVGVNNTSFVEEARVLFTHPSLHALRASCLPHVFWQAMSSMRWYNYGVTWNLPSHFPQKIVKHFWASNHRGSQSISLAMLSRLLFDLPLLPLLPLLPISPEADIAIAWQKSSWR